jgi:predicted Zn-dependent protease
MKLSTLALILLSSILWTCKKKSEDGTTATCSPVDINLFSLQRDKDLGAQVEQEIANNPSQYPILNPTTYATAYSHLNRITNKILNSGNVQHKSDFLWKMYIIKDDNTLNAFCTPGGYIYVYTGIIKYLDSEDDLAGVLGHEIAHADQRHTTETMTRDNGIGLLLSIVSGQNQSGLVALVKNLSDLKYSRCHESEADDYSVRYLSGTNYRCNGAASFFEKIQASGGSGTPAFLSTHPDPGDRVLNINRISAEKGCNTSTPASDAAYTDFKNSLP